MTSSQSIRTWLLEQLPADLYAGEAQITVDREEIVIVGPLAAPDGHDGGDADAAVATHRAETREQRMAVAREAEARFERKVSWGASIGGETYLFTHLATPVMTRLRQRDRRVLDLLVEGGVARSRADALAWCVGLVAEREEEWLSELADSLTAVREARARDPRSRSAG